MADPQALIEARIRQDVRLQLGQNALAAANRGEQIMMSGGEAEDAARAALAVLQDAGYRLFRDVTPEEEAADAALWP